MIDQPKIVKTETRKAAVIELRIPRAEIQQVMGPAIGEVVAAAKAQGIGPAGPVFAHHFRMSAQEFEFEVGVPVTGPVAPAGRVHGGALPATTVARTVYRGPYEGLGPAWGEFDEWIRAHGHKPAPDLWECYVKGPESGPDAAKWETELNRPLAG